MAGRSTGSLDVFLRLHGQRKFAKEVAASGAELEAMGVKGAAAMARFAASGEKLKKFGKSWTRNVSLPVAIGVGLAAKAAIDWESAFAGVRKTVNATEGQFASMEHGLRQMALHIPVAATDLAGIAEAAGQLGIKRKAILGFTRVIADLGVATNLAGDEGATTLARFANITQMPQSQFDRLGSTIVALGNAGASTEKDIAAMGLRIAAAGNYVGMSEPEILGYANALSSVGIEAEAGGSAISLVFKLINSAVSEGGKGLASFAEVSGESSGAFAKHWRKDAASASVAWIEGLARLKKEGKDVPALLNALSPKLRGIRVQDTLLRASGAGKLLRESLGLGTKAWKENNALTEEASKRYKTVASRLQILKNKVIDAGISLGQELLPPLIDFVEFAGPKVGAVAEAFGALPGPVKATAIGLLLLTGPVASGLGYLAGGLGRVLVLTSKIAQASSIFTSTLSPNVMTQRSGIGGAFGAASEKMGISGALQTAKGFAYSLGPAVAAYGIGNIVTSATEGDWQDAGFEAGGALAGGVLGFVVGGPMGAMLGVGLGSLGGELLSGLFKGNEIPTIQNRIASSSKGIKKALEGEREASKNLIGSQKRLSRSREQVKTSSHGLKRAEHALEVARANAPAGSRAIAKAESNVALAIEHVIRAKKRAKNAERKKGEDRVIAKEGFRYATLEERHRKKLLKERILEIKAQKRHARENGASLQQLHPINEALVKNIDRLRTVNKQSNETMAEAADQIGPKFASFLRHASREALNLGSGFKAASRRGEELVEVFGRLESHEPGPAHLPNFSGPGNKLKIPGPQPLGPPAPHHRHAANRGAGNSATAGASSLLFSPSARPISFQSGDPIDIHVHVQNDNVLHLDGEKVAENTTRHSQRKALRE